MAATMMMAWAKGANMPAPPPCCLTMQAIRPTTIIAKTMKRNAATSATILDSSVGRKISTVLWFGRRLRRRRRFSFLLRRHSQVQRRRLPAEFFAHLIDCIVRFLNVALRLILKQEALALLGVTFLLGRTAPHEGASQGDVENGQERFNFHRVNFF